MLTCNHLKPAQENPSFIIRAMLNFQKFEMPLNPTYTHDHGWPNFQTPQNYLFSFLGVWKFGQTWISHVLYITSNHFAFILQGSKEADLDHFNLLTVGRLWVKFPQLGNAQALKAFLRLSNRELHRFFTFLFFLLFFFKGGWGGEVWQKCGITISLGMQFVQQLYVNISVHVCLFLLLGEREIKIFLFCGIS